MAAVVVAETLADFLCNGDQKSKLLLGYQTETEIILLAYAELPSATDLEEKRQKLNFLLPGGVSVVGIALLASEENVDYSKYGKYFNNLDRQKVFIYLEKGASKSIKAAELVSQDNTATTVDFDIVSVDLLSRFVIGCCKCDIPVSFTVDGKGAWKDSLTAEIEKLADSILSNRTVFHLQSSQKLLSVSGCKGLPDDATYADLASCIEEEEEEGINTRSKMKQKVAKLKEVLQFDVYTDLNIAGYNDTLPTCSPVISYNTEPVKTVKLVLHVHAVSLFQNKTLVSELVVTMSEAIKNQLLAMKQCICDYSKGDKFILPEVYHFQPMELSTLFNVIFPWNVRDDQLEKERRLLHQCLCLPADRPLFRRANKYRFPVEGQDGSYLRNVHLNCPKSKVSGGKQYTVRGNYTYHHYMQDRFDDNKWGCAYRSLQTLVSWFKLQGYTERDIPTHREIQQTLVDIGDKEPSFVGSRKWIGSMEVSFVLDTLLEVQSKILNVSSGGDLASKGRELAQHFTTQGTPIMIGGGVLAHTILGVDYNEVTGDINFLILDPHYTGAEDLKTIIDKGWCGWKDANFWEKNAHYNLCMPQRPKVL
ncbi:ufm1-specific protease 2-like isoform X2 [Mercenaria mercenaria]|uniref:ufm1-specific protease 2-like isoform X2 n=1 Tax=Mercenaria mercenaria TaxID=6596 RepID=UPI00234F9484|nr:ufm1-specific protease 2-like isoform X2 [Mercenaria mercenaria]